MQKLISYRPYIQLFFSAVILVAITSYNVGLGTIMIIASILGIVLGKFFCKWMCPMGFIMELMTKNMSSEQKNHHMYNYYKVGCPISWVQGAMNKYSLFRIQKNDSTCISCGKCDKSCYIANLNTEMSLHKPEHDNPSTAFNCAKCLECVASCPNNSLDFKIIGK